MIRKETLKLLSDLAKNITNTIKVIVIQVEVLVPSSDYNYMAAFVLQSYASLN